MIRAQLHCGLLLTATMFLLPLGHSQQDSRGRKYKPPPPTCKVTVTVVRSYNGKPVENAAVVFHPLRDGKDDGNYELKTNEDGKVSVDVIPIGDIIRLQVIADGFQTYGKEYTLPEDAKEITVKLDRPQRQYSIYQKHPGNDGGEATPQPQNPQ